MFWKRNAVWVSTLVVITVLGSMDIGAALAQEASGDVIRAAYSTKSGALRHIAGPEQARRSNEVAISWNKQGPAGLAGPQGEQGPQGARRPSG